MEVIIWIVILWFIFSLIKGKIERDRLREAINNIRVKGLKNPKSFIQSMDSYEFDKLYESNEKDIQLYIATGMITALQMEGYKTEWIEGNIKLTHLLGQTIEDIAQLTIKEFNAIKTKSLEVEENKIEDKLSVHSDNDFLEDIWSDLLEDEFDDWNPDFFIQQYTYNNLFLSDEIQIIMYDSIRSMKSAFDRLEDNSSNSELKLAIERTQNSVENAEEVEKFLVQNLITELKKQHIITAFYLIKQASRLAPPKNDIM